MLHSFLGVLCHSNFLDPEDPVNPALQARVQDLFDSSASDLDPESPVSEGDTRFSKPIMETSESEGATSAPEASEGATQAPNDDGYRTRAGRKVKQFKDPMYAATCLTDFTDLHRDGKHKHFQYQAGGVPDRKVRCGTLKNASL